MPDITITLTDSQYKGLEYVALSPEDWAVNFVTERARRANDEIVEITMRHFFENQENIPMSRDEIISYAFENGIVESASKRNEDARSRIPPGQELSKNSNKK